MEPGPPGWVPTAALPRRLIGAMTLVTVACSVIPKYSVLHHSQFWQARYVAKLAE